MLYHKKIKKWSEKFENGATRFTAFWGVMVIIGFTIIPTLFGALYGIYILAVDLSTFSEDKKDFQSGMTYSYFTSMQSQCIDHEEMVSDTVYGVVLQRTNYGDYYYFDTISINGNIRPIIYSATIKKKANPKGLHIYITDMYGKIRWVKSTNIHNHN